MWTLLVYVYACVAVCVYFWQNLSAPKLTLKSAVNLTNPWPVLPPIFTKQAQKHMRVWTCVYIHMCTFHLCMLYCVWRGLQWTCVKLSHFIVSFPAWLEARVRVILLRSRKASSHCGTRSNLAHEWQTGLSARHYKPHPDFSPINIYKLLQLKIHLHLCFSVIQVWV